MISTAISETLKMNLGNDALDLDAFQKIDALLLQFYEQNLQAAEGATEETKAAETGKRPSSNESIRSNTVQASPGMAFVRACSEALYFGVALCLK